MKWFWGGFWLFLIFLTTTAAIMRPDTVDATLAFVGSFLTVAAWTLFIVLLVAIAVGGGVGVWVCVRKYQLKSLRQQDGHYPLQRVKLHNGDVAIIDPNAMVGPVIVLNRKDGSAYEHEPAAGWQVQATSGRWWREPERRRPCFRATRAAAAAGDPSIGATASPPPLFG